MSEMSNGQPRSESSRDDLPANSWPEERAAALERKRAFPYRFPRDPRTLGGKFSVAENARRLMRFFYFERRLAQAIGAWTLAIPEFEVKLESGRHLFYHADAAHGLRERLREQEQGLAAIDGFRDAEVDRFIEELLSAADAPELLVGLHQVAGAALATAYRHHIDDTDPVADAPTIRLLRRVLADYEPMLAWASAAIDAYITGGIDEGRLGQWRWHLSRLLTSIGGVTGADPRVEASAPLRSEAKPFVRHTIPERDSRFITFKHTGEYNVGDGRPRFPDNSYDYARLRFLRTQRDEVDAIEAFGTVLWDIRFQDFQAEYDLARVTWDEARHTEIGHKALQAAGYEPFELANRLTGSTCRGPMEPAYAMAEINLFGEVGVIKTIGSLIAQSEEKGDVLLTHVADFIRADERTHVRKGQHIIRVMTDQGMQELEQKTRELFTECLVSLGAVTLDMDVFTVSREDIERLVGE
jgi:hypothetical protein